MRPNFLHPYLLLSLTALFWSGNMVIGRAVRADVPPMALAFWRWTIMFVLVLPFALPHLAAGWPQLRKHWRATLFLGVSGIGGYNTFAYLALQYTEATNALLLNSFIPAATIALAWLFFRRGVSRIEGIGVLLSFIGVSGIVLRGDFFSLGSLAFNPGDLWMLAAVIVWALYTIGLEWRPQGVHPMLLIAALTAIGIVVLIPPYALEILAGRHINLHTGSALSLLYVGIFPSLIGYIFYNRAVGEVGASRASLFIHLMPVFGTLLSVIFLGEVPRWYHYAGIALIFSGIWLTTRHATPRRQ